MALRKFWSDSELAKDVARRADLVNRRLTEIAHGIPGAKVKGRGMLQGIEIDPTLAALIRRTCIRNGLIIESSGPRDEVLKVLAPLTTPDHVLDLGLEILAEAANAASRSPVDVPA